MTRLFLALACMCLAGLTHAADQAPPHESLRIESRLLDETRRINIYLPPGYDTCPHARYPVLYMPDGGVEEDFAHVAATADALIRARRTRPFLVVGIENTVRRRDMTGPTESPDDLRVTDQPGGAARFRAFIASELMPVVEQRYRVTDGAAIIGESLAGLFIVESLLHAPAMFDTYIALDPSLWWNREALAREAAERLPALDGIPARLLLTTGGKESNAAEVERFVERLRAHAPASLDWRYLPRPDLDHYTIYRGTKEPMLEAAFPPRAPADPDDAGPRDACG